MNSQKLKAKLWCAALLLGCSAANAQTGSMVAEVAKRLEATPSYAWRATTEFPDAPIKAAPIAGAANKDALVMIKPEGSKEILLRKGDTYLLKRGEAWQRVSSGEIPALTEDLFRHVRTPAEELRTLADKLSDVKLSSHGSITGALDSATARVYLETSTRGRTPQKNSPVIQSVSGTVELWVKDGLPERYQVALSANLSLPFGTKHVTCLLTTHVKEINPSKLGIPAGARELLEPK